MIEIKTFKSPVVYQLLLWIFIIIQHNNIYSQKSKTQINGFGHFDNELVFKPDTNYNDLTLGEHDLFINSDFNEKFSFLGEFTLGYTQSTKSFTPKMERVRLKYNYIGNHSLIVGKIHTPVNYWNDVFHHGRLFFPTIDRPLAFKHITPIHTFGLRLQGQNLGNLNFGYDIVLGNGMSSFDKFSIDDEISLTIATHIKPIDGMRIGGSYYYNHMIDASLLGSHTGHHNSNNHMHGMQYSGPLDFQLINASIAYFSYKIEFLNEFGLNITKTDTLGIARNFSNYLYCGYRIKDIHVPFFMIDFILVDENDLHAYPLDLIKFSIGYKHEFSHLFNIKLQLERYTNIYNSLATQKTNITEIKIQLAYGF